MTGQETYPGRTETATLTILAPHVTALTLHPATVDPGVGGVGIGDSARASARRIAFDGSLDWVLVQGQPHRYALPGNHSLL